MEGLLSTGLPRLVIELSAAQQRISQCFSLYFLSCPVVTGKFGEKKSIPRDTRFNPGWGPKI